MNVVAVASPTLHMRSSWETSSLALGASVPFSPLAFTMYDTAVGTTHTYRQTTGAEMQTCASKTGMQRLCKSLRIIYAQCLWSLHIFVPFFIFKSGSLNSSGCSLVTCVQVRYGLYTWHWPVVVSTTAPSPPEGGGHRPSFSTTEPTIKLTTANVPAGWVHHWLRNEAVDGTNILENVIHVI